MGINTEIKHRSGEESLAWALELSNPALDDIWKEQWLRDGIGSRLEETVKALEMEAGSMRYRCDRIALVAEGAMADMLQAMLALADASSQADRVPASPALAPGGGKVRLIRAGLSAGALRRAIEWLGGGSAGLIGVAAEPESPAFCAVFATLRKTVADRYSQEKKARIKAIAGPRSTYLKEELELGDMEGIPIPAEYDPVQRHREKEDSGLSAGCVAAGLASSPAMLFPMMAAGVNAGAYVRGFREMLSSTWWDQDADRYGLGMGCDIVSSWENSENLQEDILCWQPELLGVCRWLACARRAWDVGAQALYMPQDEELMREYAVQTTLFCREEPADILLPVFPGVTPEGSLSQMVRETVEQQFAGSGGVLITMDSLDAEELGRLMAYLQLSLGIAGWVARNQ